MMTENKRFQIIHLGNPYDFVVKDHNTNKTYGTLQGDDKSLMELLNELAEENKQCKEYNAKLYSNSMKSEKQLLKQIKELKEENKELQEFKDKVFNLIDKTIESETQIAENIESTIEGDYVKAVNRLTIIAFKNLKKELSK